MGTTSSNRNERAESALSLYRYLSSLEEAYEGGDEGSPDSIGDEGIDSMKMRNSLECLGIVYKSQEYGILFFLIIFVYRFENFVNHVNQKMIN